MLYGRLRSIVGSYTDSVWQLGYSRGANSGFTWEMTKKKDDKEVNKSTQERPARLTSFIGSE
ncbi:hypothetical protein RYX36_024829 [Vicia faba]